MDETEENQELQDPEATAKKEPERDLSVKKHDIERILRKVQAKPEDLPK